MIVLHISLKEKKLLSLRESCCWEGGIGLSFAKSLFFFSRLRDVSHRSARTLWYGNGSGSARGVPASTRAPRLVNQGVSSSHTLLLLLAQDMSVTWYHSAATPARCRSELSELYISSTPQRDYNACPVIYSILCPSGRVTKHK